MFTPKIFLFSFVFFCFLFCFVLLFSFIFFFFLFIRITLSNTLSDKIVILCRTLSSVCIWKLPLLASASQHCMTVCFIAFPPSITVFSQFCPQPDLLLFSCSSLPSLPLLYCHTLINSTAPSSSSHSALLFLALLHSLAPSSLHLIHSRSSTSQIDFAAALWSPINSQIGFPTYPIPLDLCISFFHSATLTFRLILVSLLHELLSVISPIISWPIFLVL